MAGYQGKINLNDEIYMALKKLQLLPMIFGKDKADQYEKLASTLLETQLARTIENGDGTITVYLAFSERGKYGEGNIGVYKLVQSKRYNPFDEKNSTLVFTELLPYITRKVANFDFGNGTITFLDENEQQITFNCIEEHFEHSNDKKIQNKNIIF